MLAMSFWIDRVYDFFAALQAVSNERKQDLIFFIATVKKSTDVASVAKYRASEPNRAPSLLRIVLGELSLIVRPIHRSSPF